MVVCMTLFMGKLMRQHPDNPTENVIPPGTSNAAIIEAIESSGYPLQSVVAGKLTGDFGVTEEWGYIDRDSGEHRSLDVFAFKLLGDRRGPVQPAMALLIECKKSKHPYAFFHSVTERRIPDFPAIAGLSGNQIAIEEVSSGRRRYVSGAQALGLNRHPFVEKGPPRCSAFSRIELKGNKADASGSEIFNGLVLPLVKAHDHSYHLYRNRTHSRANEQPRLLLNIAVVDAPMILVEHPDKASDPLLSPWVRIIRHEARSDEREISQRFYVVDMVHHSFFERYICDLVMPLATVFAERATEYTWFCDGVGTVPDLDNWTWEMIRSKERSAP